METLGKIIIAVIVIIFGGSMLLNIADYIYCKILEKKQRSKTIRKTTKIK